MFQKIIIQAVKGHFATLRLWLYILHVNINIETITHSITSDETPCDQDNPCRNGGTCSGTILNYQCACAEGYTGKNCESKLGIWLVPVLIGVNIA